MPARSSARQHAPRGALRRACLASAAALPAALALRAAGAGPLAAVFALTFVATAPGLLAVLALGWREPLPAAAWGVRALALAPLVWVAATLGPALAFDLSPWGAALGAGLAMAAALAGAALASPRVTGAPVSPPSRRGLSLLLALGPAVGLAGLGALAVLPVGARFSYHGYLHTGVVAQLASGVVPPENPGLAGEPIGFYWLYHWLLATWASLARVSVLAVSPCLNALALALYVGAAQRVLRRFLSAPAAAAAALVAPFAGDLAFAPIFAVRTLADGLPAAYVWPFEVLLRGGLGGDPRPLPLLAKFLNMGGVGLGLALWAALLAEVVPLRAARERVRWDVVSLLLASAVLLHATTALGAWCGLAAGLAAAAAGGARGAGLRARARALAPAAAAFAVALVLAAPFVLSVTIGTHAGSAGITTRPSLLLYNARTALGAAPLLAIAIGGALRARRDPAALFLAAATGALLALGVVVELPDNNQYKFPLVAALPGGLLLFRLLAAAPPRARRAAMAAALVLSLAAHGLVFTSYVRSAMAKRAWMAGDGLFLALPDDPDLDAVLRWLRTETSPEAVVVTPPARFAASPTTPVSGRGEYVQTGGHQTDRHPATPRRLARVQALFGGAVHPSVAVRALRDDLDRPLYVLLVQDDDPERFRSLRQRLAGAPETLVLVYETPRAAVWRVRR